MSMFQRLALLAMLSLCGCGGSKDDAVKAPLSSASAPACSTVDGVTRLVELCDAQSVRGVNRDVDRATHFHR